MGYCYFGSPQKSHDRRINDSKRLISHSYHKLKLEENSELKKKNSQNFGSLVPAKKSSSAVKSFPPFCFYGRVPLSARFGGFIMCE